MCALEYRPGVEIGGPVRCWGYNHHGQAQPPEGIFLQVSAGRYHSCAIRREETVTCWGEELRVPKGRFLQISVGEWHVCGILQDGTAQCWGRNDHKQSVPPPGEFLQIGSGEDITCGLRPDGHVECWGEKVEDSHGSANRFKQLSVGSSRRVCGLTLEDELLCWGKDEKDTLRAEGPFTQVSTSPHRTCAIKADGRLWCAGEVHQTLVPEGIRKAKWSELSVGGDFFCAIAQRDSSLHCFGSDMRLFGEPWNSSPEDFAAA